MNEKTRGMPPVGIYTGKVHSTLKVEQRESRSGKPYESGTVEVQVKGGRGPVDVDGLYEFGNLTYSDLDFFNNLSVGDVFIFAVGQKGAFKAFTMLTTRDQLLEALNAFEE